MLVFILGAYALLLGALALAARGRRDLKSPRTFFIADGRLSWGVTAASLVATSVGGTSTVVTAALVFKHGLAGVWIDIAGAAGLILLALGIARRVRETGVASIAELAGHFYGSNVRRATAAVVVLAEIAWLALLAKATTALLAPALPSAAPWLLSATMLLCVLVYTALGGQAAVAFSDVLQLALMALGLLVLAPIYVQSALAQGPLGALSLTLAFPTSETLGWLDIGAFVFLMGLPHLVGSDIYAKLLSAKDGASAARGAFVAGLAKLIFAAGVAYLGLAAARLLPVGVAPDQALGALIHEVMPPFIVPWVLLALVATTMSSADQVLLSGITLALNDLAPSWAARRGAKVVVGVVVTLVAFGLTLALPTVVDAMKVGYTVFAAGVTLPLLMAILGVRVQQRAALAAMLGGAVVGAGLHVARLLGLFQGHPVAWGLVLSAMVLLVGLVVKKRDA